MASYLYHWCFWSEAGTCINDFTVLPTGLSYRDAQNIVLDQVHAASAPTDETFWYLGTIGVGSESRDKWENAKPLWRLHVPAKEAVIE